MARILIVEDDPNMQMGLRDNLTIDGHEVEIATDGETGLTSLLRNSYDLAILDVMLPKRSGFDVLREIRGKGIHIPVIMLTAKGEEIDKVLGLELGADDYITKPFGLRELLARIKAVLRRNQATPDNTGNQTIMIGQLEVDFKTYRALQNGKPVEITARELDVLRFLWEHRNQVVSRDQLLSNVWGVAEYITTRTVDNFILRLRQKIEQAPTHPRHIITVHGMGYKLVL